MTEDMHDTTGDNLPLGDEGPFVGGTGSVVVAEAVEVTAELVEAFCRLVPQLSSSAPVPTAESLGAIVDAPATVLLVALDANGYDAGATPGQARETAAFKGVGDRRGNGSARHDQPSDPLRILGSLTLAIFRLPTGLRAWIEDVVVDQSARGRGVGECLVRSALERAEQSGATTVDLTSRPSREAANRLYSRLGFDLRETNVYRYRA